MQILGLKVQNLRNLELVDVKFDGRRFIEVTGKNGSGKSSLLDALFAALIGPTYFGRGFPVWRVIQQGRDKAVIEVKIGNADRQIEIRRSITAKKDDEGTVTSGGSLSITDTKGEKIGQDFLNRLLSEFTVDPLRFGEMTPKEQGEVIKRLSGVNFDGFDQRRAEAYEDRKNANSRAKLLDARIKDEPPQVDEVDIDGLMVMRREIDTRNKARREQQAAGQRQLTLMGQIEANIARADQTILDLEARLNFEREARGALVRDQAALQKAIEASPEIEDEESTEAVDQAIQNAGKTNAAAAKRKTWEADRKEFERAAAEAAKFDVVLKQIDEEKRAALESSKLPFKNLEFSDTDGVLVGGIPFSQKSSAEQIRISTRIGMEIAPELKIIRIPDGSLLDAESYEIVKGLAEKYDYQVLVESVGEKGGKNQIVLRAGHVISQFAAEESPQQAVARMSEEL